MSARPRIAARGFALAETLIALTLLSFGLTSSVALLLQALRHERESTTRTAALRLAASLGDELRALRRPDGRALLAVTGETSDIACAEPSAVCAAESSAAAALVAWREQLTTALPAGARGSVEVSDPAIPAYLIAMAWPSAGADVDSELRLMVET